MSAPRKLTNEEVRDRFMEALWRIVDYWEKAKLGDEDTVRSRLSGVVFSILNILDGTSMDLPAFQLKPDPHSDDARDAIENGENYFPSADEDCDISCGDMLHEYFYAFARERGLEPAAVEPATVAALDLREVAVALARLKVLDQEIARGDDTETTVLQVERQILERLVRGLRCGGAILPSAREDRLARKLDSK